MSTIKRIKHDKYVDALCHRLEGEYDKVLRHVPIYAQRHSRRKVLLAEIDILAYKDGCCDIYEVKCSHRIVKARRQLQKINKLLSRTSTVKNSFFFCGESGRLMAV